MRVRAAFPLEIEQESLALRNADRVRHSWNKTGSCIDSFIVKNSLMDGEAKERKQLNKTYRIASDMKIGSSEMPKRVAMSNACSYRL